MIFKKKKEVNYELYYKNTFIRILINKKNYSNKYIFIKKPSIEFFFLFKNIKEENIDSIRLFNHCIFFWLITGKIGIIKNLNVKLHRGVRYYRYQYICKTNDFFRIINFINEIFYSIIQKNTIKNHLKKKHIFLNSYNDLSMFTNLKLLNNLYLNSVHNKIFLKIYSKKKNLISFLDCLKIK